MIPGALVPHTRRWMLVAGTMALLLDIGCYSFQRPATSVIPTGAIVRLRLTAAGTTRLARFLGPRVVGAEGTLASVGADGALVVGVDWVDIDGGQRQPWTGEGTVTFPRDLVAAVDQRTFNRQRSILAGLALGVGLGVIAAAALATGGAHTTANPGGGVPAP